MQCIPCKCALIKCLCKKNNYDIKLKNEEDKVKIKDKDATTTTNNENSTNKKKIDDSRNKSENKPYIAKNNESRVKSDVNPYMLKKNDSRSKSNNNHYMGHNPYLVNNSVSGYTTTKSEDIRILTKENSNLVLNSLKESKELNKEIKNRMLLQNQLEMVTYQNKS